MAAVEKAAVERGVEAIEAMGAVVRTAESRVGLALGRRRRRGRAASRAVMARAVVATVAVV